MPGKAPASAREMDAAPSGQQRAQLDVIAAAEEALDRRLLAVDQRRGHEGDFVAGAEDRGLRRAAVALREGADDAFRHVKIGRAVGTGVAARAEPQRATLAVNRQHIGILLHQPGRRGGRSLESLWFGTKTGDK